LSYRPFLELGEGGMAKVFLARAQGPGGFTKLVVLKTMRETDVEDGAIRQMFVDEARLSARFNHPNLVQVQEVSLHADPPFLVMEYLDGKPMSALRSSERITLGMRLAIISEVLTGLHHAHTLCDYDGSPLGIVHRDVSPHNVFITYDGSVKVLDFGIAKMVTNSTRTEAGEIKGKLAYMAPEQMLGATIDRRADVFSVGSLLWEAAVGKRMWDGMSEAQLMHRLAIGDIPRPSQHGSVDQELEEIIVKATASDPDQRFSSAQELQQELDRYRARAAEHCSLREIGTALADTFQTDRRRSSELISAALQNSMPPPPAEAEEPLEELRPPSRAPWLVLGALLLLAGAGVLASNLWSSKQPERPAAATAAPTTTEAAWVDAAGPAPAAEASAEAAAKLDGAQPAAPAKTRRKGAPRAAERTAKPLEAAPLAPASAPAAAPDCSPPYYFVRGIKTYKPECL
jgi:eukaryotic-like serine/threonine-protein kinase